MKCKDCLFYVPARYEASNGEMCIDYDTEKPNIHECHRYPPVLIKMEWEGEEVEYNGWPLILKYGDQSFDPWCGEFKDHQQPSRGTIVSDDVLKKNIPPSPESPTLSHSTFTD